MCEKERGMGRRDGEDRVERWMLLVDGVGEDVMKHELGCTGVGVW